MFLSSLFSYHSMFEFIFRILQHWQTYTFFFAQLVFTSFDIFILISFFLFGCFCVFENLILVFASKVLAAERLQREMSRFQELERYELIFILFTLKSLDFELNVSFFFSRTEKQRVSPDEQNVIHPINLHVLPSPRAKFIGSRHNKKNL